MFEAKLTDGAPLKKLIESMKEVSTVYSVYTKMEGIKATIKVEVKDVLAELDFLHKVDQRRDLYEATAIRRAVHR